MLKNIVEAVMVGSVLGIALSAFEIIEIDLVKYFIFAGIYFIITILYTMWYLKGHILLTALIGFTVIQLLKTQTGD